MKSRGYKNFAYARFADVVSLVHVAVVIVAVFGWWLFPNDPIHFLVLVLTLVSWMVTGSCVLAHLELKLRRAYLDTIQSYEHGYLHYHLRHLTGYAPSLRFIRTWGYVYLSSAIVLWIVRFYVTTSVVV